jgi:hypothetical protein
VSSLLLEYGLKNDVLKAIKRGRASFNLHTENRTLLAGQKEFGQVGRIELGIDFTRGFEPQLTGAELGDTQHPNNAMTVARRVPLPQNVRRLPQPLRGSLLGGSEPPRR